MYILLSGTGNDSAKLASAEISDLEKLSCLFTTLIQISGDMAICDFKYKRMSQKWYPDFQTTD